MTNLNPKRLLRKVLRKTSSHLPLKTLQSLVPRTAIGLFYHVVAPNPPAHIQYLYQQRPIELFQKDLLYILEHFQTVDYPELHTNIEIGSIRQPSQKTLLHLSFDDGFAECYDIVRPLLLEYQVPCTFFVATGFIDNHAMYYRNKVSLCISEMFNKDDEQVRPILIELNREFGVRLFNRQDFLRWMKSLTDEILIERICASIDVDIAAYLRAHTPYLTSEQMRNMAHEGFTIGAHSRRHHKLGRLSPAEMEDEIVESCETVAALTGQFSVPFSFPNSGDGVDRNFLADIRKRNPQVGLFFDTKALKQDRNFIMNRIWAESPWFNPDGSRQLPEILHRAYLDAFSGTR